MADDVLKVMVLVYAFLFMFLVGRVAAEPLGPFSEIIIKLNPEETAGVGLQSMSDSMVVEDHIKKEGDDLIEKVEKVFMADGSRSSCGLWSKATTNNTLSNIYKLTLSKGADWKAVMRKYKDDPRVVYVEPNYAYQTNTTLSDPYYAKQWAHQKMLAEPAWATLTKKERIVVAIVDTGADTNHPDLKANLWDNTLEIKGNQVDDDANGFVDDYCGWDFVNNDNHPEDDLNHGTHVAGIIGAKADNGKGVVGLARFVQLMILKAGYKDSRGRGVLKTIDCVKSIKYAADNGARIINMSWGGYYESSLLRDIIAYAFQKGVLMVAAAGNNNSSDHYYPAAFNNVMGVCATDQRDHKAYFSNYGSWTEISAPGVGIYSTMPNGGYAYLSGTSMAAPYVSALSAVILSENSSYTASEVRGLLKDRADNIDTINTSYQGLIGSGRINAFNSLGLPLLAITEPAHDEVEKGGLVSIVGSAIGGKINGYELEWGAGSDPILWQTIHSSAKSKYKTTLGSWNTKQMDEGTYTLRVRAANGADEIIAQKQVVLTKANISLSSKPELQGELLNYPNPFRPTQNNGTRISYNLTQAADVSLYIFDMSGTVVVRRDFVSTEEGAKMGDNNVNWDGINDFGEVVSNGVYFYSVVLADRGEILGRGKMIALR